MLDVEDICKQQISFIAIQRCNLLSVPFESNEEWNGISEDFGGLMGTADLKLACMFSVDADTENRSFAAGVRLYNMMGEDIQLLPDDFCWEYRLYKTTGNKDESDIG